MNNHKKSALLIFLTFLVTSALYFASFVLIPSFSTGLNSLRSSIGGSGASSAEVSAKIDEINAYIEGSYYNEYDRQKLNDMAIKGYVAGLGDKYSQYYTKSEYKQLMSDVSGNYKGVGIEVAIDNDNLITVLNAYEGAPASKAGIRAGDKLIKVNGTSVDVNNYDLALNMIRGVGEYGKTDTVTITVKRDDQTFDAVVTREEITVQSVSSKIVDGNIGYIQITSFAEETDEQFIKHINILKNSGATSLIIDLRNNGGGLLTTVVYIADYLLPESEILTIKAKNSEPQVYKSDATCTDMPICVLINGNSASASEVLAGALKDNKKAVLVGETSYGKGVVQTMYDLSDGAGLKITTAKYYTPSGECIDQKGIKPDVEVTMELTKNLSLYTEEEDIQLQEAIKQLKK